MKLIGWGEVNTMYELSHPCRKKRKENSAFLRAVGKKKQLIGQMKVRRLGFIFESKS